MRFCRHESFLLLAALSLGCADSTAPEPIHSFYVLESVNGQPLPAVLSPLPEESISVLSATLEFDSKDHVTWAERRRELSNNVPRETVYTTRLDYRRDGPTVEIGYFDCPPNALCPLFTGVFIDTKLHLTVGWFSPTDPIVYVFGMAALLD